MSQTKRIARLILGWFFIVLGLLGLVLPILQGILFLVIGVLLLAPEVPFFHALLQKLKTRYPKIARKADKITKRVHRRFLGREHDGNSKTQDRVKEQPAPSKKAQSGEKDGETQ